jgi:hypothetical protein
MGNLTPAGSLVTLVLAVGAGSATMMGCSSIYQPWLGARQAMSVLTVSRTMALMGHDRRRHVLLSFVLKYTRL